MRRTPPLLLVVSGVLVVLLPLLAYFQFQWLGKVGEQERAQMQTNLRSALAQFRDDFDREIARIFLQFQAQPDDQDKTGDAYAKLYAHWQATAVYPKLIKDIFYNQIGPGDASLGTPYGASVLRRLNATTKLWEPADWTAEFGPLRLIDAVGPVDGSNPAIVIPRLDFEPLPHPEHVFRTGGSDQIIIRLDLQYLRNEFIPELVRSHFGGASDYRIQIRDAEDRSRVIYTSDSNAPADAVSDADERLLGLRLSEYRNMVPASIVVSAASARAVPPAEGILNVQMFHGVTGFMTARAAFDVDPGLWTVSATHRSGSLDAAVAQARHHNMVLSFGILSILAAGIAIVLISAERAHRLAGQQMQFVSAVSHELRTPLAVICSAGENLADGVVRDSEQLKNYGKVVRDEGRRLAEMVEQVLSFAGIQSGLQKYRLVPIELATVIDRALNVLAAPIRESGFIIERDIPNAGLTVLADEAALARALQNVIGNAIKYSGTQRWIRISAASTGEQLTIAVQDRGIGIAASERNHIFEPFFRGREAIDSQIQGSGLGLSLVKEIVHAHNGEVGVTSNPEGGCTFCIRLPLAP